MQCKETTQPQCPGLNTSHLNKQKHNQMSPMTIPYIELKSTNPQTTGNPYMAHKKNSRSYYKITPPHPYNLNIIPITPQLIPLSPHEKLD